MKPAKKNAGKGGDSKAARSKARRTALQKPARKAAVSKRSTSRAAKNEPASKKSGPVGSQKVRTGKPSPFAKISGARAVKSNSPPAKAPPVKSAKETVIPRATPETVSVKASAAAQPLKASVAPSNPVHSPAPLAKKAAPPRPKKEFNIPAILLEGDSPISLEPKPSGPGRRYALAPEAAVPQVPPTAPELPESYGTGRLFLSARDPHWLYAAWDVPMQSQRELNSRSRDGHLVLRVFANSETGTATPDIHVHPESRTWFVYVPRAETRYRAELGYYDGHGQWNAISHSRSTYTPPDAPSQDVAAEFATIPAKVTFQQLVETVQEFVTENRPLVEAIMVANQIEPGVTEPARVEPAVPWTPERVAEITTLFTIDRQRRVWMGSLEITELIRRKLEEEAGSIAAAQLAREQQPEVGGISSAEMISSPYGGEAGRARRFWFNINAELVIYGATEPDATVTVGDRKIKLRPDGSFSFRFALPDGRYDLPVAATSSDKEESKEAHLEFSRRTDYRGEVATHPQDPSLRKPSVENVA